MAAIYVIVDDVNLHILSALSTVKQYKPYTPHPRYPPEYTYIELIDGSDVYIVLKLLLLCCYEVSLWWLIFILVLWWYHYGPVSPHSQNLIQGYKI